MLKKKSPCYKLKKIIFNYYDFFFTIEAWILYGRKKKGVSIAVENAYEHYEKIEFSSLSADKNDPKRHIKLINVSEEVFSNTLL